MRSLLSVLALFALTASASAQPQANNRTQWEYGQFAVSMVDGNGEWTWETDAATIVATSAKELLGKLGAKPEKAGVITVLNKLGAEGWELVSHTVTVTTERGTSIGDDHYYTFKRRR